MALYVVSSEHGKCRCRVIAVKLNAICHPCTHCLLSLTQDHKQVIEKSNWPDNAIYIAFIDHEKPLIMQTLLEYWKY